MATNFGKKSGTAQQLAKNIQFHIIFEYIVGSIQLKLYFCGRFRGLIIYIMDIDNLLIAILVFLLFFGMPIYEWIERIIKKNSKSGDIVLKNSIQSTPYERKEIHTTQLMQEYGELVNWIKQSCTDVRVFKNTDEMIILGAENWGGTVFQKYYISKEDNDVIIEMKSHHPIYGEINHKWRFWDSDSIDNIIEKINNDMYLIMKEKETSTNV